MANHKSAKKRAKQTITKTLRNKTRKSEVKTVVKSLRDAIDKNDKPAALELLPKTQKLLDKLAQSGIIKSQTAARKNSRLHRQVSKLQ